MIATDKSHTRRHIVEWTCTGVLIAASGAIAGQNLTGIVTGCVLGALYVVVIWLAHRFLNRRRGPKNENLSPVMGRIMFDAVVKLPTPVFICDEDERILWYNTATEALYSSKNKLYGESVKELFGVGLAEIRNPENGDSVMLTCEGRHFLARYTAIKTDDNDFCLIMTDEITEEEHLRKRLVDKELAAAYIYVDNFAEMMQYDSENYRIAAAKIDEVLRDWAEECGGILKEYERDKYLFLMEKRVLAHCVARKFDVLDRVRAVRAGDFELPMTISMGVSNVSGSLADREKAAHTALDMALQRGGDQAVVKGDASIDFYGGITKTVQKRTNVRSRVVSGELVSAMKKASNVLVMGHRNADFDSIGSCVGLTRLAMYCGARVNMIVNRSDRNLTGMLELLGTEEDFLGVLIDEAAAFDLVETGTLVVVGDVNNVAIMESPELARRAGTLAIIDHHRKVAEFDRPVAIEYIEPSASSASELVAEMLEQVLPKDELPSQEATLLLSGIILDTQQFTRSTGTRTFSAAMFLRDCGAMPEVVMAMNRTSMDDYQREGRFRQNILLYRGQCAIACAQTDNAAEAGPADRIIAAKAANNLLSVEGIEASFALMKIGDVIHISARSSGSLNVQLILEKIGGGGHYDAAGAQLSGITMREAVEQLKAAIDTQL
ncbi:MAG: DHH family phosphoesterase [Eubacteriales bacterium]|nr:DHH family phosphoesterase [Clostridiales bacterium]MDD7774675.1 DHH family phosphoesterase [Eubacteriales bacterium]MDY3941748.1 DHH family phosphoesterase [Eubacteriales bacterium]